MLMVSLGVQGEHYISRDMHLLRAVQPGGLEVGDPSGVWQWFHRGLTGTKGRRSC